jgi:alginate O-acetyltransferase complex protein AlgJ
MPFHTAIKLTVPFVFFGYAAFANFALFTGNAESPPPEGFMRGGYTKQVDTLYRANLPHREPAVGLVGAARYLLLNEGRDGVVAGDKGWLFTSEEYRAQSGAIAAMPDALAWMAQVHAELAAYNSRLVIVPVPAKIDIDQSFGGDATQSQALRDTYDLFLTAAANADLIVVDTRADLVRVDSAFFQTDTHWTPGGAAAIAASVAESGLIELGEDDFLTVPQAPVTFTGDLVSFVTSDALAVSIGLNAETVTPYVAQMDTTGVDLGGFDLFGSDGPMPMVLVGTSYSANPNWSFVEALKLALSQDILNYAVEGQGPIAPMQTYLQQLDPVDAPPVVIWEFPIRYLSDPDLLSPIKILTGDDNA